jgi:uncharacterized Zn finger protein (UPF0148 family)
MQVTLDLDVCPDCGAPMGKKEDQGDGLVTVTCPKCDKTIIVSFIAMEVPALEVRH